jgi:phosphoribosylformimino-5-aminoimidazole carboxamide ribotide isomerase
VSPRIIPVLDVMNGQVVRAVAGRRSEYKPVESKLTRATDPVSVARALVDATGARELYLADLDSILGRGSNLDLVWELVSRVGVEVWTDYGYRTYADACRVPNEWVPGVNPVIGSETLESPHELQLAAIHFMPFVGLSIDLRGGELLGNWTAWREYGVTGPTDAAGMAQAALVPFLFVIDLARVGEGAGTGTETVCREIVRRCPDVELIAGGGVRDWTDVDRLGAAGATGVLVASALHDGALTKR